MSWRDELNPGCDLHQVLYRDDIEALGCVLRLHGSEATYAYHDHGRAAAPGRVASPTMRPGARSSMRSALTRARSGDGGGPKAALC